MRRKSFLPSKLLETIYNCEFLGFLDGGKKG